jgi:pantetheine-phosphate adenylyltransferase
MIRAIYAGTFDPITVGHLDIINRSLKFCDNLVVAIGNNPDKKVLYDLKQRVLFINKACEHNAKISVGTFSGLLVDYAKQIDATILVRGIRSVSDFEYEINLANINKTISGIETVFLPTSPDLAVVSSSMVKEIARHGGDVSRFVPDYVGKDLISRDRKSTRQNSSHS